MERQLRAVEVLPESEVADLLEYNTGGEATARDGELDEVRAAAE